MTTTPEHRNVGSHMHHIGAVAEAVDLSISTISILDEVDLVPPSGRSPGGVRRGTDVDLERLRVVMSTKPLELPLAEMCNLLVTSERMTNPATGHRQRCGLAKRLSVVAALVAERESFGRAAESPWGSSLVSPAAR